MVVGTGAGAVRVLRLTGPLGRLDGVDSAAQARQLETVVQSNLSVGGTASKASH